MFYSQEANGGITLPFAVLLPDAMHLSVESIRDTDGVVVIVACATGETAACPAGRNALWSVSQ